MSVVPSSAVLPDGKPGEKRKRRAINEKNRVRSGGGPRAGEEARSGWGSRCVEAAEVAASSIGAAVVVVAAAIRRRLCGACRGSSVWLSVEGSSASVCGGGSGGGRGRGA